MKSSVVKHAITINGHETSITLEDAFWNSLKEIAHCRRVTLSKLLAKIDETRQGNLSSAIRVFVLEHIRNGNTGK
jgi:predicted DNA-binding ribbon-helix-helix protein